MSAPIIINIVPANPYWEVVIPCWENEKVLRVDYEPVVAWRIETFPADEESPEAVSFAYPITAEPSLSVADFMQALKRPSGTFFIPGEEEFKSEEAYIFYITEKKQKKAS